MKKLTVLFLSAVMLLSLAACGNRTDDMGKENKTPSQNNSENTGNQSGFQEDSVNKNGKILIAYFAEAENSEVDAVASPSIVTINGNTVGRMRALADMIQAKTGGDLFSIQTSVDYPADIGALIEYAADEQENNVRPELTSHIENLDNYDTIFIGYPNWWYDMPMVLYSFFDEYDFSGKTIIPFNSHNGSRFSSTIQTIQELEPNATVITDGFTISERNVADAEDDINEWLNGLEY